MRITITITFFPFFPHPQQDHKSVASLLQHSQAVHTSNFPSLCEELVESESLESNFASTNCWTARFWGSRSSPPQPETCGFFQTKWTSHQQLRWKLVHMPNGMKMAGKVGFETCHESFPNVPLSISFSLSLAPEVSSKQVSQVSQVSHAPSWLAAVPQVAPAHPLYPP